MGGNVVICCRLLSNLGTNAKLDDPLAPAMKRIAAAVLCETTRGCCFRALSCLLKLGHSGTRCVARGGQRGSPGGLCTPFLNLSFKALNKRLDTTRGLQNENHRKSPLRFLLEAYQFNPP